MKAIVIGGVAAGMSAASKLRRVMPDAQITVYERGGYLSYGACGLPYYIGGFNDDPGRLIARTSGTPKCGLILFCIMRCCRWMRRQSACACGTTIPAANLRIATTR